MVGSALLIGNSLYQTLPPLPAPAGDVEAIGERLVQLGFQTHVVVDVDTLSMNLRISEFCGSVANAAPGSRVLFYFAGHGAQLRGENYLLATDAQPPADGEWQFRGIKLSDLLGQLCWRADQQKLIALDACRTDGMLRQNRYSALGLSEKAAGEYADVQETMILHSTGPGRSASDGSQHGASPFCRALMAALEQPQRPLVTLAGEIVGKVRSFTANEQVPWMTGTLSHGMNDPFVRRLEVGARVPHRNVGTSESGEVIENAVWTDVPMGVEHAPAPAVLGAALVALRRHRGLNQWEHFVMLLPPQQRMQFCAAADELLSMEGGGFGIDGKGIIGKARRVVDFLGGHVAWDIWKLTPFGAIVYKGSGAEVPAKVQHNLAQTYGVAFDWSDWDRLNGAWAEIPLVQV